MNDPIMAARCSRWADCHALLAGGITQNNGAELLVHHDGDLS
ncbi:MAG: hypothetical protein ABR881_30685 [Candidatus Sulfotelmatobacter sp.]